MMPRSSWVKVSLLSSEGGPRGEGRGGEGEGEGKGRGEGEGEGREGEEKGRGGNKGTKRCKMRRVFQMQTLYKELITRSDFIQGVIFKTLSYCT